MKSTTEKSFGARIGKAENLVTALQGFNGYQPVKPELSASGLSTLILGIKSQNNQIAISKQNYSLAIEHRMQIFEKGSFSLHKILSPINATVKVIFGKEAKESLDIAGIIAKIRGANIKTLKDSVGSLVSQSHQSYHSKIQYFADLIANLSNLGAAYVPFRTEVSLVNLKALQLQAVQANTGVMETYTVFAQQNEVRISAYSTLSKTATLIKESIKAQYGFNSVEYGLVKKLRI